METLHTKQLYKFKKVSLKSFILKEFYLISLKSFILFNLGHHGKISYKINGSMVQWGIEQSFQNDMESWKGLVCLGQYFTCGVMLLKSRIQAHGDLYGKEEVWMPSVHMVHYTSLLHYSVYWVRFLKICFISFTGCLWQNHVCLTNQGSPWYLIENQ